MSSTCRSPSSRVSSTQPVSSTPDTVEHWEGDVPSIEWEMSILNLRFHELQARLSFARGRHLQVVREGELARLGPLKPEPTVEVAFPQDDELQETPASHVSSVPLHAAVPPPGRLGSHRLRGAAHYHGFWGQHCGHLVVVCQCRLNFHPMSRAWAATGKPQ